MLHDINPSCFGHHGFPHPSMRSSFAGCGSCTVSVACLRTTDAVEVTLGHPGGVIHTPATAPSAAKANARQVAGDHYQKMGIEPWDVVDTWPLEQRIGAYRHGELKYLMRMGSKDARLQEIRKGGHYNEKLAEVLAEAAEQQKVEEQQAHADRLVLLQRILDAYSPDDSIADYQDKIRGLLVPNNPAKGRAESASERPEGVMLNELLGWTVQHPKYGKWFIPRAVVISDWKQDHAQAYPDEPEREPSADEVETWWNEQTTWIEIAANGNHLERP